MDGNRQEIDIVPERRSFVGLSISVFDQAELSTYIINLVEHNQSRVLYGYSLWTISALKSIPELYFYAEQADLFVTDGRPFYLLAKLHGLPLKLDLSIPGLVLLTLNLADKHGWSIFLLGTTEEINSKARENLKRNYRGIKNIAGHNGFFKNEEESKLFKQINELAPNILLIGTPSPGKERIAIEIRNKVKCNIIIPCGGMLDVLGGKTKVTPGIIKRFGLASVYRLIQEPRRLFKRTFSMYFFLFFNFLPVYLYYTLVKRDKDFSIYNFYLKNKMPE